MTGIYFIRHAESDSSVTIDRERPLTSKGYKDVDELVKYFKDIEISTIYTSPYRRAIQTVKPIADYKRMIILERDGLKERLSYTNWLESFEELTHHVMEMWKEQNVGVDGGESIKNLRQRNIEELERILETTKNTNIIVGTHGSVLASIISYYKKSFNGEDFLKFIGIMPYIVLMKFDNKQFIEMQEINYRVHT